MDTYEFGVGTKKWSLESDDMVQAYITMSLWVKQNIPVAVYKPQQYGFMPKDILEINEEVADPKKIREIMETIKELS